MAHVFRSKLSKQSATNFISQPNTHTHIHTHTFTITLTCVRTHLLNVFSTLCAYRVACCNRLSRNIRSFLNRWIPKHMLQACRTAAICVMIMIFPQPLSCTCESVINNVVFQGSHSNRTVRTQPYGLSHRATLIYCFHLTTRRKVCGSKAFNNLHTISSSRCTTYSNVRRRQYIVQISTRNEKWSLL